MNEPKNTENNHDGAVRSSDLLGATQETGSQDEIRRLRVQRDATRLGLSESESDRLYNCRPRPSFRLESCRLSQDGKIVPCHRWSLARIAQLRVRLQTRLYRTLCVAWILILRQWHTLRSSLLGMGVSWCGVANSPNDKAQRCRRKETANETRT
jgi:hypothetical protein